MDFKLNTQDIGQASIEAVIEEYDELLAALNRPHVDGWYGFSPSIIVQIENRLIQIRERLADQFLTVRKVWMSFNEKSI